jgi:hypothetical protein
MRITKAKLSGPVIVTWEEDGAKEGDTRVVTFTGQDSPHEDLAKAGRSLMAVVLGRMELGNLYDSARLSGVSITRDERYELGFVATLLIERAAYNSPLVLNSPFVRRSMAEEDPDNNPEAFISPDEDDALASLLREVEDYVNGQKRAQGDLFEQHEEEPELAGVEG